VWEGASFLLICVDGMMVIYCYDCFNGFPCWTKSDNFDDIDLVMKIMSAKVTKYTLKNFVQ